MAVVNYLKDIGQYKGAIGKGLISNNGKVLKPFWEVCYTCGFDFRVECFTQEQQASEFVESLDPYNVISFTRIVPKPYQKGYAYREF